MRAAGRQQEAGQDQTGRGPVNGAAAAGQRDIRDAQQELGRDLVRRRQGLGYSQTSLARLTRHARSTLHACEKGDRTLGSHELWQDLDNAVGAGGALVGRRDDIAARAVTTADAEVRAGLRAPGGRNLTGTVPGGSGDPITAARACPACGHDLVFRTVVLAVQLPAQAVAAATALTLAPQPGGADAGGAGRRWLRPRCRRPARSPGRRAGRLAARSRRRTGPRTGPAPRR